MPVKIARDVLRVTGLPDLADQEYEDLGAAERAARIRELASQVLEVVLPREAQVLRLRFGLEGCESHTQAETARELGIPPQRVRQIECKVLRSLYHHRRRQKLRDFLD